jgi:hypothetical integral membrane protein (TIGR02206 family)
VRLFGPLHLALLAAIAIGALALVKLCRARPPARRPVRLALGWGLALNELAWWGFRYGHEGIHLPNLPLQLCDVTLWTTVLGCLTSYAPFVEFAYFAGMAGAGMALVTPDLWSPWPSYPALYFFAVHGGIVAGAAVLVFGGEAGLRAGAMWRAYGMLLGYAAAVGAVNAVCGANFMYLCRKPVNASPLDMLGPWPVYLLPGAVLGLVLFWLLGLGARRRTQASN